MRSNHFITVIVLYILSLFSITAFADTVGIYDDVDYAVAVTSNQVPNEVVKDVVSDDVNVAHLTMKEEDDDITESLVCIEKMYDVLDAKMFNHVTKKEEIIAAICVNHVKYDVPYELIASIIYTESTFKVKAKNRISIGLMQINTRYHKSKGLNTVSGNIECGVKFIKGLIEETGSIKKAVSRYNGGSNNKVYINRINKNQRKLFS